MFDLQVFEDKVGQANSHYEWFKKSSLHELIELLKDKSISPAKAKNLQDAVRRIPQVKREKYRNALAYLKTTHPAFAASLMGGFVAVGQTSSAYEAGKIYRHKDNVGRWHEIVMQQKGNSCGPACVRMVKLAHYPQEKGKLGEKEVRDIIAQVEKKKAHQGLSSSEIDALHEWSSKGIVLPPLVEALKSPPAAVKSARAVSLSAATMRAELAKCTPRSPAIILWFWRSLDGENADRGGHFTVCVGPGTPDKLVILDPWNGVQYLDNTEDGFNHYQVVKETGAGSWGAFDPNAPRARVILTT